MLKLRSMAPSLVYGVAWTIAVNHPFWGFVWLLLAGFLVGIVLGFEGFLTNVLIATFVTALMGIIAVVIPFLGELADLAVLIIVFMLKVKTIMNNFWLIVVGFLCYTLLFYWPDDVHRYIAGDSEAGIYGWLDFFIGTGLMALISYGLEKAGYAMKRIYVFTIGLPGFLFLFNYGKDSMDNTGDY